MFRLAHSPVLHQSTMCINRHRNCVCIGRFLVFSALVFLCIRVAYWIFWYLYYQICSQNLPVQRRKSTQFYRAKKSFLIKSLQCLPMKSTRQQMTFNSKTNKTTLHSRCFIHKPSSLKTHAFDHTIQNLSNFRLATFARFQSTQFSEKWSAEPSWIKPIKHGKNVC